MSRMIRQSLMAVIVGVVAAGPAAADTAGAAPALPAAREGCRSAAAALAWASIPAERSELATTWQDSRRVTLLAANAAKDGKEAGEVVPLSYCRELFECCEVFSTCCYEFIKFCVFR